MRTVVARRIRTGTISVNGGLWFGPDSPFGGYKESGLGREHGVAGLRGVPRDQGLLRARVTTDRSTTEPSTRRETLEERVQRLEDLHDIEQLLVDYGEFLDLRDLDGSAGSGPTTPSSS